jgi:hypothetical protein
VRSLVKLWEGCTERGRRQPLRLRTAELRFAGSLDPVTVEQVAGMGRVSGLGLRALQAEGDLVR